MLKAHNQEVAHVEIILGFAQQNWSNSTLTYVTMLPSPDLQRTDTFCTPGQNPLYWNTLQKLSDAIIDNHCDCQNIIYDNSFEEKR